LKNQNKRILKLVFRNSPLILAILCIPVFFTFEVGFAIALSFAGLGANNTFLKIADAEKITKKKVFIKKTGGICFFTYVGMVVVVVGTYLVQPFSILTMSHSNAFLIATIGAGLVAVCNQILIRNLANWI